MGSWGRWILLLMRIICLNERTQMDIHCRGADQSLVRGIVKSYGGYGAPLGGVPTDEEAVHAVGENPETTV